MMKVFFRMGLVMMLFLLVACTEERLYTHGEMLDDIHLVDKVMTKNARDPTEISAQNLKNAKEWFPNKFANRKSNFSGIFKNSDQN